MRFPGVARICIGLSIAAVLAACSASRSTGTAGTGGPGDGTPGTQDPGVTGPGGQVQGHDTNPKGVAYPTANVGYTPRQGNTPGNVINNYKFYGYPNSDVTKGLQPVALADYFDPDAKDYKIIHIIVSGVWCIFCKQETDALVPLIPMLASRKVVFLTALSEDNNHKPAQTSDLDYWVRTHHTNFTQVLDPGNAQLGPFFDAAAIPWNANVDARTMEILSAGVGAPPDVTSEVQTWLDWVDAHPIAK